MRKFWTCLFAIVAHFGLCLPHVYEPTWTYKCLSDGCQRIDTPQTTTTNVTNAFESLDLCRTVCGRWGGLWPRPTTAALSSQTVKFHPNYLRYDLIDVPVEAREMMVQMTQVISSNIMAECGGNVTEMVTTPVVVYISVGQTSLALNWDTNEEYILDVKTKASEIAVHVVAKTIYGARHGLETFSQLISSDKPPHSTSNHCGLRLVSGANIKDSPVYKYRGFLLDTSRNFFPVKDIKRMLDGMAATKLNVFHWHATDSHSFPLESTRVPQFTRYGAYSSSEIYSTEEVRELVTYAQVRGIRLVIEIDAPAHAGNGWQWGKEYGLGDLAVCVNEKRWRQYCVQAPCGQLNPANPDMYRFLKELYRDIAEVLPKPALFHMGGDEVFFACWNSSEAIVSYMTQQGYDTTVEGFIKLWSEFHSKALKIWDEALEESGAESQQPVMLWSSALTQANRIQKYLDKDRYIIEVWEKLNDPLLSQLLRLGYRTVSVPKNIWYLDHGFWGTTNYSNWRKMYAHTLPRDTNMLGGEVAMWSEYVDSQALDTRVWPRAAAVAERLWTDPTSSVYLAESRIQRLRSRLITRGLQPDALSPEWCVQHDGKCL